MHAICAGGGVCGCVLGRRGVSSNVRVARRDAGSSACIQAQAPRLGASCVWGWDGGRGHPYQPRRQARKKPSWHSWAVMCTSQQPLVAGCSFAAEAKRALTYLHGSPNCVVQLPKRNIGTDSSMWLHHVIGFGIDLSFRNACVLQFCCGEALWVFLCGCLGGALIPAG